jgi:hypothetical protein
MDDNTRKGISAQYEAMILPRTTDGAHTVDID